MAQIRSFINNSTIKTKEFFIEGNWNPQNYIEHFYNYGRIETANTASLNTQNTYTGGGYKNIYNYGYISGYMWLSSNESGVTNIINYGEMGGVSGNAEKQDKTIIIDNLGVVNLFQKGNQGKKIHFKELSTLILKNYAMKIDKSAGVCNAFDGQNANDNAHLVVESVSSVEFANSDSRIILDFGEKFELGKGYLFSKLVVDTSGDNALGVDFDRLMPKSDIHTLIQSGEYFIVKLTPQHSAISNIYKSNIRTMNNFYTLSNSMIYPRKSYYSQNLGRTHSLLQHSPSLSTSGARGWVEYPSLPDSTNQNISSLQASEYERGNPHYENIVNSTLDSVNILKSYESFAYRNESINRRIQRQNKRNYSRTKRNNNSVILSDSEKSQKKNNRDSSPKAQNDNGRKSQNLKENQTFSQNLAQNQNNYYFILTPFVNHNYFFESGRYNLSGFDYGFLTAFSAKVAESNSLGAHFIFSYGSLGDKQDKDLSIKSLNLNVGLNYKLDLVYDMYLKARGDFFYFLNQVKTLTMFEAIKPNNLGFGASVAYGKDFDFGKGGMLGIEAGIDYKALKTNAVSLNSQTYKSSLYNLIYADVGINYNKYFGGFGINATLGIKGNITANKLATSKIHISTFNKSVDMVLDNDKYLAYANAGISCVLNTKNFDVEFSLAYYGNYGDRVISNGGGVESRVVF